MADFNRIAVQIAVDGSDQAVREMHKLSSATGRLGADHATATGRMAQANDSLLRSMRSLSSVIGAVGIAYLTREYIRYADTQTMIGSRINLVAQSESELASTRRELFDISQRTRSQMEATVDLYSRIGRNSKELKLAHIDLLRITESVNKSIVISGGNASSAQAAIVQFGQALASGVLRGDELRSVMEQSPRLAEAIAKGMGRTIGDLRKMGEAGKLTAHEVVRSLLSQSEEIDREYGKITMTVGQAFTMLDNAIGKYIGDNDRAQGASALFARSIANVAENVDDVGDAFTRTGIPQHLSEIYQVAVASKNAVSELFGILKQAPGLLVPLGVAAYYAASGSAALTTAYLALTGGIAASMAANPLGWVALGIGAVYLAAGPAVKALDELIYKHTQLSLTGEAAHNAEMKRAAEAEKAWEHQKQRALFMHKEGGIPLSPGMKVALGPQASDTQPPKKDDDDKTRKAAEDWRKIYADLRKEIDLLNPAMTEQDKKLLAINNKYDDLEHKKGANIARLKELRAELIAATTAQHASAMAIKQTADFFKEYLRLAEAETPQHGDRGAKNIAWEKELEMLASLQPTAEADKLNEQIAMFTRLLEQIPEKADEVGAAIDKLKADFAASSGLDALLQGNKQLEAEAIADPFERQRTLLKNQYDYEKKMLEDKLKLVEKGTEHELALKRGLSLKERRFALDSAKLDEEVTQQKISTAAEYLNLASGMFSALAGTIDQSSRSGFEAAKAMNLAGAITSTAAGVMLQFTSGDPYTAWFRAAAVGVEGAIQIATIMATQYKGAASAPPVPSGGFGGAGNSAATPGGSIGAPFLSVRDSQTQSSLQGLAYAADNASLAIGKVADGLTKIGDLFESGLAKLAAGASPNIGATIQEAIGWSTGRDIKTSFGNAFFPKNGDPLLAPLLSNMFGWGNKWAQTGGGFTAGLSGGDFFGQSFSEFTKKGGWFSSDKHSTEFAPLNEAFAGVLKNYLDQIKATIIRSAVSMGTAADFAGIDLPETKIATAGRTAEDIQKDLEDWFTKAADILGQTVEGLKKFTFYGESAFDSLVRLSTSLQGVNDQLSLVGANLIDSTLAGANTAYKLTEMMGGLDAFAEKTDAYFEAMFSEEEQKQRKALEAQRQVTAAFAEMNAYAKDKLTGLNLGGFGLDIPGTREEFRDLVNGLDLTTEAGAALFAGLMDIAEAFGTVQDAADEAAEKAREFAQLQADSYQDLEVRLLRATGQGSRADIVELLINQSREWNDYVEKGLDTAQLAAVQQLEYANALKQVAEATQQASDALKGTLIDTALAAAQALKNILGGDLSTASPEQKYISARRAWDDAMAKGQANLLPELGQALLTSSRGYNASGAGYVGDFDRVTQALADAAGIGEPTLTAAQQQVDLLTRIKDYAGLQVDATTTLSGLMSQYLARSAAGDVLRMATGLAAADMRWDLNQSGGIDISDALLALQGQRPSYAVGTAYVPHDMTADIHQGEMIWTRQFSEGMRRYGIPTNGAADNRELIAELKEVKAELREIKAHAAANVKVAQAVGTKTHNLQEQQNETQYEILRVTKRSA